MPRSRWLPLVAAALVGCAAFSSGVAAAPVGLFSWYICPCESPPSPHLYDVAVGPGADVDFGVAIRGLDQPYAGFDFEVEGSPLDGGPLPGAWRFDAGGCQPSDAMWAVYYPSACMPRCDQLIPDGARPSLCTYERTFVAERNVLRLVYAIHWDKTIVIDPTSPRAYFVCALGFNHWASVTGASTPGTCGGVERPMCFRLVRFSIVGADGSSTAVPVDQPVLSANAASAGGAAACMATPARGPTWGGVKAHYR